MPILYETHLSSNLTLEIPESEAIERYLARKFGFWGRDAWEETAIHVFYCSSKSVLSLYVNKVLLAFPDTKSRELAKFVEKEVPGWIVQHEKWLGRSQTSGFYVGNQVTFFHFFCTLSYSQTCMQRINHPPSFFFLNVAVNCRHPLSSLPGQVPNNPRMQGAVLSRKDPQLVQAEAKPRELPSLHCLDDLTRV